MSLSERFARNKNRNNSGGCTSLTVQFRNYKHVRDARRFQNGFCRPQVTVVFLGILCVGMVFLVDRLGDIFQLSLTVTGITAGAMLGLFSLGMLVPWATTKGAVVGGLVSMVTMIWIIVGAQWHMANRRLYYEPLPSTTEGCLNVPDLFNRTTATTQNPMQVESVDEPFFIYRISFMYYTLLGALIVMVIGTIVSFICGAPDLSDIDRDHFPPFITRCVFECFVTKYKFSFEMFRNIKRTKYLFFTF